MHTLELADQSRLVNVIGSVRRTSAVMDPRRRCLDLVRERRLLSIQPSPFLGRPTNWRDGTEATPGQLADECVWAFLRPRYLAEVVFICRRTDHSLDGHPSSAEVVCPA